MHPDFVREPRERPAEAAEFVRLRPGFRRYGGMDVKRGVVRLERFGNGPECQFVEISAAKMRVEHGTVESKRPHAALDLGDCPLDVLRREYRQAGETIGIAAA